MVDIDGPKQGEGVDYMHLGLPKTASARDLRRSNVESPLAPKDGDREYVLGADVVLDGS